MTEGETYINQMTLLRRLGESVKDKPRPGIPSNMSEVLGGTAGKFVYEYHWGNWQGWGAEKPDYGPDLHVDGAEEGYQGKLKNNHPTVLVYFNREGIPDRLRISFEGSSVTTHLRGQAIKDYARFHFEKMEEEAGNSVSQS